MLLSCILQFLIFLTERALLFELAPVVHKLHFLSLMKVREELWHVRCYHCRLMVSVSLLSPKHRTKGDLCMWKCMCRHYMYRVCLLLHLEQWAGCEGLLWEGPAWAVQDLWDPQSIRHVLLLWLLQHQLNLTQGTRSENNEWPISKRICLENIMLKSCF